MSLDISTIQNDRANMGIYAPKSAAINAYKQDVEDVIQGAENGTLKMPLDTYANALGMTASQLNYWIGVDKQDPGMQVAAGDIVANTTAFNQFMSQLMADWQKDFPTS